ncbi:ATP-binding protein [Streptomyces sp. B1866]|uniref:ATP-binding protein n=1 Tax=Streptomyces sp. B1866 TaxID=3075431 RepID=UPI0028905C52|nr:ATP-binding protein [Streptomyces sp. B1866]MDT3395532.1 ATP-binding protein [Streptomyces sp. B1866]
MSEPAPPATHWRFALPHTTAAVPLARALVRFALSRTGAAVDRETAELLTTELVANAVQHTDGDEPLKLIVARTATGWQVEVHDPDPSLPGGLPPPADREGRTARDLRDDWEQRKMNERGRGLRLLRTLSADSGYRATAHGKVVWFTLPASPPAPP